MKKLMLMISVIVLISISGCERWFTTAVRYEVNCDPPGFKVSYTNGHGDFEEQVIKEMTWNKEIAVDNEVDFVQLWATSDSVDAILNDALNAITGRIYVEGNLEDEATSEALGIVMLSVEL